MRINKRTMKKLVDIQKKYTDEIMKKKNVLGMAIGEKKIQGKGIGKPAIVILVEKKEDAAKLSPEDLISSTFDSADTDVIEVGIPKALQNTQIKRPTLGGISIGHPNVTAGTLGCLLRSEADGLQYILSNNHVLADTNRGISGDAILQPGGVDGGTDPVNRIATLYRYPEMPLSGSIVDCAIAKPTNQNNISRNILDSWSDVKSIPGWFGSEDQGSDVALFDISQNGRPDLVVFHLDNPGGDNHGYYRIGWNVDSKGNVTGGWSDIKAIPGWFGWENQGGGIAIADISGNGRPDLIVYHIDNPGGDNHGYYRIGWNLDTNGNVSGGWSDVKAIPGWFGWENQGGGIAIADINNDGRPELFVYHIDNPGGDNHGYYRIGWKLNTSGDVSGGWSNPIPIPGWFGWENQGGGIAIADFTGNGKPDLVIHHIDNPGGENISFIRIGYDIQANGNVTNWSEIRQISGWMGSENQGGGIAAGNLNFDGRADLIALHVDNPSGENHGYYRVALNLGVDGACDFTNVLRGTTSAYNGLRVWKSGRTTELTNGSIVAVNASINVNYHDATRNCVDQLIIQNAGKTISAGGDSGSAVVDSQNRVVGLLFAGSDTITIANKIDNVLESLRYSSVKTVPGWFGWENQGADVAMADISGNGRPDMVVFHVDNPGGENHGYYRIGWNVDANGDARDGWSDIKTVPGWFGSEDQGAGIAIYDISGNGRPDLIVYHIDNPGGENHGYYRIGWNLDANGNVTGGWSDIKLIPGWFGSENQDGSIAIADISGNGKPDLIVFHIDNPGGENHGYYRIGWNLDANGNVTGGWSDVKQVPGWFGSENQGAGIAIAYINSDARPDLVVFQVDNPGGENHGYYRIGWNLDTNGTVSKGWSGINAVPGWFGSEDQGAGIAFTDLNGNGRADLIVFHVDNPRGDNHGYYRVVHDIMPTGRPARWSVS